MQLISDPVAAFHNETIHSYEQYVKGNEIRFNAVSTLLANTMLNWLDKWLDTPVKIETLADEMSVTEDNQPLFIALLRILQKANYLKEKNGFIEKLNINKPSIESFSKKLQSEGLETFGKGKWLQDSIGASFELARACIPQLPMLLRGEITSVQLLFSAENYDLSLAIYAQHLQEVYYGLIAEQVVRKCHQIWDREPERQIRIIEVGAGSGKGTIRILQNLQEHGNKVQFFFTDVGNSFLRRAKRTFKDFNAEMNYRILDISANPEEQGYEAGSFDIAFATNVLHATPDLRETLGNMHKLLTEGGSIYINEITEDMAANTVTYGTTPGWWLPTDGLRLPYSPVATTNTFRELLAELGFGEIVVAGYPGISEEELVQAIIQGVKK